MFTIWCNMPIHCHFLLLPLGFSSTTRVPAVCNNGLEWNTRKTTLNPGFPQSCTGLSMKAKDLQCLRVFEEIINDGLKSPVKNYSLCVLCSRKKPWFTKARVLIICSSNTRWLPSHPPRKGFLAICPLHHRSWMTLQLEVVAIYIFQSILVLWKCISLTDATLFIWVHPQKEQLWTGNSQSSCLKFIKLNLFQQVIQGGMLATCGFNQKQCLRAQSLLNR